MCGGTQKQITHPFFPSIKKLVIISQTAFKELYSLCLEMIQAGILTYNCEPAPLPTAQQTALTAIILHRPNRFSGSVKKYFQTSLFGHKLL